MQCFVQDGKRTFKKKVPIKSGLCF